MIIPRLCFPKKNEAYSEEEEEEASQSISQRRCDPDIGSLIYISDLEGRRNHKFFSKLYIFALLS